MSDLSTLLTEAAEIMLIGMVTVFAFLATMVWLVGVMSRLAQRYSTPEPETPSITPPPSNTALRPEVVAAVSAAVHQYRAAHPVGRRAE